VKKQLLVLFAVATVLLSSCGKDDKKENESPYKSAIVGKWELTHFDGVDIGDIFDEKTTITFGADGSYSGAGAFGDGSGYYTLSDNNIKTFINNELFITYDIISLKDNVVEATMKDDSGTATIKAKKI